MAPHAPDTCSLGLLHEVAGLRVRFPVGVHTHLAQSQAEVQHVRSRTGRSPAELLEDAGLLDERLVAAHCIYLEPDDIARVGRHGINVAHAPVGTAKAGMVAPIVELQRAGARITLCTDSMSGDMFEAMRQTISVGRIRGAGYAIKARTVAGWATREGAAALAIDADVGALTTGRKADIILLDAQAPNLCPIVDGFGVVVHSGVGANVVTVLVDGEVVLEDGRPTRFDGAEVIREAQAVATRLWKRSGFSAIA